MRRVHRRDQSPQFGAHRVASPPYPLHDCRPLERRPGNGQLLSPDYFAVDGDGNAYVSDDSVTGVMKFSALGKFIWRVGGGDASDPDLVGGSSPGRV